MLSLYILLAIAAVVAGFVIYRLIAVRKASRRAQQVKLERIQPLLDKLETGIPLGLDDVMPYARDVRTRETAYSMLKDFNLSHIFPPEFYSLEKSSEANLANWLEFPTELAAIPDEIFHIRRVTIDYDGQQHFVHYEVFRFRVFEPHWASDKGWMLGVVGPYFDDSQPYDWPQCTFSRLTAENDASPETEAKWVHEKISK
ncbi:hypothetical protein [Chitinophaga barathri]|uniref:Uncharacterized protein n=1 Tax=Chitinophaga barathri TaxID=1647451 RepID=A0A3N4M7G3_9BACT|nr:hypothetical protein [Chitinophaga barathri]RPD39372.1 hypothetical protein EG028_19810 [Chitinophaga barathri]